MGRRLPVQIRSRGYSSEPPRQDAKRSEPKIVTRHPQPTAIRIVVRHGILQSRSVLFQVSNFSRSGSGIESTGKVQVSQVTVLGDSSVGGSWRGFFVEGVRSGMDDGEE